MTDLGSLLKAATPDPPVDVSVTDVAGLVRRRRVLAPAAASIVVVALAVATFAVTRRRDTAQPARPRIVVSAIGGLHFPHPDKWAVEVANPNATGPFAYTYLTDAVPAGCRTVLDRGCRPSRTLSAGQTLVVVRENAGTGMPMNPNRVLAGVPARVDPAGVADCPVPAAVGLTAALSGYGISVCGGAGVDPEAFLDGLYLDRPARKDLGLVVGRSIVVGGPAPGLPRPRTGTVRVGSYSTKTDADGRFAVAVPPGTYRVRTASSCSPATTVQVRRQRVSTADLTCNVP